MEKEPEVILCGCHKCINERLLEVPIELENFYTLVAGPGMPGWRYACEICGNKRCPHHTDHNLACTNSNKPGQPGSDYQ